MKKQLLALAIVVMTGVTAAHAQIQKGNVLVGGNLTNLNLSLNSGSAFSANLSPKAAWFVKDNVAVGAYVNFGLQTAKNSSTQTTYGVGALGRYYINDKNINVLRNTRFFLEGTVGIQGYNISNGGGSTNGLGLGFGPGIAYFITPNIGLEALLKYDGIVGFGSSTTTSQLGLNVGFQIYLPSSKVKQAVKNQQ